MTAKTWILVKTGKEHEKLQQKKKGIKMMGKIVLINNLASSHRTSTHKQNETVKGHNAACVRSFDEVHTGLLWRHSQQLADNQSR